MVLAKGPYQERNLRSVVEEDTFDDPTQVDNIVYSEPSHQAPRPNFRSIKERRRSNGSSWPRKKPSTSTRYSITSSPEQSVEATNESVESTENSSPSFSTSRIPTPGGGSATQKTLPRPRRDNLAVLALIVLASVVIYASSTVIHRNAEILMADDPPQDTVCITGETHEAPESPPATTTSVPAVPSRSEASEPSTPKPPPEVQITFDIAPDHARVSMDGQPADRRMKVAPSTRSRHLVIAAPGYRTRKIDLVFNEDRTVRVTLKKWRPRTAPRKKPRPALKDTFPPEPTETETDMLVEDLAL